MIHTYSIEDFNDIAEDGFDYELPMDAINLINKLSDMVGAPTYQRTPIFARNSNRKRKPEHSEMEWELMRKFQVTTIKKNTDDKHMQEARIILNKITSSNYHEMKENIIQIIDNIVDNNSDLNKLCNFIFDTASTNKFYSKLYAELYACLINKYELLKDIFKDSFDNYITLFDNIESVSSTENYDLFCKTNKINDTRRAMSSFIVNLMKQNVIELDVIYNIVLDLHNKILTNMSDINNKHQIEEICENISLLFTGSINELREHKDYNLLLDKFKTLRGFNVSTYPGFSNKIKFKYMDMIG